VVVQEGQRVLSDGPYRAVRHPSYTGSILTVIGTATALGSVLGVIAAFALVVPAYMYRIRVEERTMIAGLGEEYGRYRARTQALLPGWPAAHPTT
jgi:protein-S-isoprenylcysteine O-methyltransferase Ste14